MFARTDASKGRAGITCFIVDSDTPGFHVRRVVHTLRSSHYATELEFKDCWVSDHQVLGEVNKPGEYPFRTNLTLDQAVATAGGFTYRAARRKIFIRHVGQAADVRVSSGGDDVVHLQPGDTVRIGERFF